MKMISNNGRPLILVSNDDGYNAPGLHKLVNCLKQLAKLVIVAPDRKRSGSSMSITNRDMVEVERIETNTNDIEWYKCSGTPVDCVKLAFCDLMKSPPDLVISGINKGYNIGNDSLYSGTVSVGLEAATKGYHALCFSYGDSSSDADYNCCVGPILAITKSILQHHSESRILLNVNIPPCPKANVEFKVCHQGSGHWDEEWVLAEENNGTRKYRHSGLFVNTSPNDIGSDIWALKHGYVSVVPLGTDLTDNNAKNNVEELLTWSKS